MKGLLGVYDGIATGNDVHLISAKITADPPLSYSERERVPRQSNGFRKQRIKSKVIGSSYQLTVTCYRQDCSFLPFCLFIYFPIFPLSWVIYDVTTVMVDIDYIDCWSLLLCPSII